MSDLNNKPSDAFRKEIMGRAANAIAAHDVTALMSLVDEIYATGYGSGYADCEHDNIA